MLSYFKKSIFTAAILVSSAFVYPCTVQADDAQKKILFIDSYHEGYGWSDGITAGIKSVLDKTDVQLRIHRMDTKRHQDVPFMKQAALDAKKVIEEYKPDVVIATDDNASKYLIVPYYKDADLPFVWAGLNWTAEKYGYPFSNATGMIEVNAVDELIDLIMHLSEGGQKIGVLTSEVITEHKENDNVKRVFGIEFAEEAYVLTVGDWKKAYIDLQDKVDILLIQNNAGIPGWDDDDIAQFVLEHAKIPSGTVNTYMARFVLIGYAKVPDEQGSWAAQTALDILGGKSPADIAIVKNQEGRLYVNIPMAEKIDVEIPADILEVAEVIIE